MKTFRTLDLAIKYYEYAEQVKVTGNLRDQLLRAASSISLNLAEGNAKSSVREKKRYYQTAYASLKECETVLKLLKIQEGEILKATDFLGASLYKLMHSNITVKDARLKNPAIQNSEYC